MTPSPRTHRRAPALPRIALRLSTLAAAALLAACSSTPLPPWPSQSQGGAQPARVVPPPLGTSVPPEGAAPVSVTPLPGAGPELAPAAPEPSAADARFAPPTMRYDTPGLGEGRRAFTTQAELGQWLQRLATTGNGNTRMQMLDIGRSQRGAPLWAMVFTRAAGTDVAALEASGRPTVLLLGQQHGDEPASAEALLVLARELAPGGRLEPLLDVINVLVVPRANPDGAEAGQHALADGTDLDRDHLALSSPEAQALARLVRNYRPMTVADAHEHPAGGEFLQQFGLLPRADLLYAHATTPNLPEFLVKAAREWYEQPMERALTTAGLRQELFHAASASGGQRLSTGRTEAESARNVNGLKNAVSLMVSGRGADLDRQQLQRRVHAQVTALTSVLRSTVERAADLESVRSYEARDTASQACRGELVVRARPTAMQRELVAIDPQTGADRPLHLQWDMAQQLQPVLKRPRPCGYWLAASATTAVERLRLLGVQMLRVAESGGVLADVYEQAGAGTGSQMQLATRRGLIDVPPQSYYVPLNQPLANLVVAALEPDTDGSYLSHRLVGHLSDTARVMSTPSLVFEEMD
ncbi:M14 family metallopeptidase [Melaminivora sp.]|uniref:M14 family metallopeptidase n=1 Tax=Melaminivora sp. TaxID=1933032 RepID=UPI0028AF2406|nr:M14 family metallopeptidase [Melaminivora sp.]